MSVSVSWQSKIETNETPENNVPALAAGNRIVHSGFDESKTLNASSSPPAEEASYMSGALTAGAATIDLTALTGLQGTIDLTGLKVQIFRFKNTSANNMTLTGGNTNPYNLCGASWQATVYPNGVFEVFTNDGSPDVASGAKEIDIAGTNTGTYKLSVIGG